MKNNTTTVATKEMVLLIVDGVDTNLVIAVEPIAVTEKAVKVEVMNASSFESKIVWIPLSAVNLLDNCCEMLGWYFKQNLKGLNIA